MTPTADKTVGWYEVHADALARQYEAVPAAKVHAWLESLLPPAPGLILDIGAGTGRDAAWLASQGHQVVAVEPSSGMRRQGQNLHPVSLEEIERLARTHGLTVVHTGTATDALGRLR